jgi:hypothetical protein
MRCPVCAYPVIPGTSACVQCGEPRAAFRPEPDGPPSWYQVLVECRGLEAAGDTDAALALYERLIADGLAYPTPYHRAAVLYARRKDTAAEERVVRLALARLSDHTNGWFVVRLAKLLTRKRAASEQLPSA